MSQSSEMWESLRMGIRAQTALLFWLEKISDIIDCNQSPLNRVLQHHTYPVESGETASLSGSFLVGESKQRVEAC